METMETEIKRFVSSVGLTEYMVGALILVGITILLQSSLFGPNLKHIPRVGDELGRWKRLKEYTTNGKSLHREGYRKVSEKG
jgi:hypothetical protein